jgi:hypothetical protein
MIIHWDDSLNRFQKFAIFETEEDFASAHIANDNIPQLYRLNSRHTVAFGANFKPHSFPLFVKLECGAGNYTYSASEIEPWWREKIIQDLKEQKEQLDRLVALEDKLLANKEWWYKR